MTDKNNKDCDRVEKSHHSGRRHGSSREMEDIAAAKMAVELFHTHDQEKIAQAWELRERISTRNPKAWDKAMKQLDDEEAAAKKRQRPAPPTADYQAPRKQKAQPHPVPQGELNPTSTPQPRLEARHIPGYAPDTLAPATPASPAFDAAYNRPPAKFYGLDIGIVKLGVTDRGSVDVGVNIGIAKAEVQAGLENRVDGEFMPIGGPLHARAGAGLGYDIKGNQGLHSEVGAGANFFNAVNGDFDIEAHANKQGVGTNADLRGRALPVDAQFDAGANVGSSGVEAYTGGDVSLMHKAGMRTGGEISLGRNSRMAAGVGLEGGGKTVDLGTHIESYGNRTIDPKLVDVQTGNADEATFYPTGNRNVDYNPPKR